MGVDLGSRTSLSRDGFLILFNRNWFYMFSPRSMPMLALRNLIAYLIRSMLFLIPLWQSALAKSKAFSMSPMFSISIVNSSRISFILSFFFPQADSLACGGLVNLFHGCGHCVDAPMGLRLLRALRRQAPFFLHSCFPGFSNPLIRNLLSA